MTDNGASKGDVRDLDYITNTHCNSAGGEGCLPVARRSTGRFWGDQRDHSKWLCWFVDAAYFLVFWMAHSLVPSWNVAPQCRILSEPQFFRDPTLIFLQQRETSEMDYIFLFLECMFSPIPSSKTTGKRKHTMVTHLFPPTKWNLVDGWTSLVFGKPLLSLSSSKGR